VTYVPIARQRLGKHIPAGTNVRDNMTSVARQQRSKYASSTIHAVFSVWYVPRGYKGSESEDATEYSGVQNSGRQRRVEFPNASLPGYELGIELSPAFGIGSCRVLLKRN
jgi:hypothetical protein